jgi:hypothetical protein
MAVGASAAWAWSLQSIVHGGLLDLRFATEADAGVPAVATMGVAAALGLIVATGIASRWAIARRSPS